MSHLVRTESDESTSGCSGSQRARGSGDVEAPIVEQTAFAQMQDILRNPLTGKSSSELGELAGLTHAWRRPELLSETQRQRKDSPETPGRPARLLPRSRSLRGSKTKPGATRGP